MLKGGNEATVGFVFGKIHSYHDWPPRCCSDGWDQDTPFFLKQSSHVCILGSFPLAVVHSALAACACTQPATA